MLEIIYGCLSDRHKYSFKSLKKAKQFIKDEFDTDYESWKVIWENDEWKKYGKIKQEIEVMADGLKHVYEVEFEKQG